jgi:hypothetical protein
MATALNGLAHLIPFGQAFPTGTRLALGRTVAATENEQDRQHANKPTRNLSSVICHSAFRPVTLTSSVMISPSSQIKAIPPSRRGVSESS